MINSLLTFGAKSVKPEILEQTLTVRKETVNEIEKNCVNKTLNSSTWQSLIISPRGSGKTHIVKVLYHRLKNNKKLSNKLVIAYMSEDEVGIANFTDLMVSILRAFVRYNEVGSETLEAQISEASLIKDNNKREIFVKDILIGFADKRIIILLIENFDKILKYLGSQGQRSLRDFIHQYNNLSIIATSQNLIANLQDSKSPFYNFFNVFQLNKLDYKGTVRFLEAIAKMEGNLKLMDEIKKPEFEGKLRAIYELTEGNHRLLVTFYSFLKADFKSELSGIFIKVMNDLKPYYEQFVNALPPQQQKIVKYLSLNRGAVSGKEIARACFIEPNVFSKQISLLYDRGMIDKNKSGKDVFYELKEPLMRICFEISESPNGISNLFVDFLSAYYDRQIIREQYLKFKYGARFQSEEIKNKYENEALMYGMTLNPIEQNTITLAHDFLLEAKNQDELDSKIHDIDTIASKQMKLSTENFNTGNAFIIKKQYKKGLKSLEKVIKIDPNYYFAYYNMGIAFSNLKQYKDAIKSYKKSVEINPDNDSAYNNMGVAYGNLKQYEEAMKSFQMSVKINPENDSVYYNMGNAFLYLKQYKEAIKSYQDAVEIKPNDDSAYYNMGIAFSNLKQYEEAIKSYQKAVEIKPDKNEVYYNMGNAFSNLKQYEEAIKSYQKAVEVKPDKNEAYYNLGIAYTNLKQYEKAIKSFQKAVEVKPDKNEAYYNLGIAYTNLKQYEKAIKSFQKAIEINPDYDAAYYNMGIAYSNLKKYEEAIKSYQKAIEINPDNDGVYNSLGLIYLKVDKIDNAFEAFHKGLEINPDNKYTNFSLLGAYVRINDQNKSKELMINLINKVEKDLLTISLTEDVFYNLFRFGSDAFINSYFDFLLKLILKEKKDSQLWKALPDSLFDILINIEDYDKERLNNIEKALTELLAEYQKSIIPLKMFSVGVAYLKNKDKNAIFKLSKEERKLFKEAVLNIHTDKF